MKSCKKLGNEATKAKLVEAHRVKMLAKKMTYKHFASQFESHPYVAANQSRHSEHYGEIPAEQTIRMLAKSS